MTDTGPLIISKLECRMLAGVPRARPDAAFVLSYGDGRMRTFARAPGFADRAGSKWCFVVDKSQRFSTGDLRVPARGGVYFFDAYYEAGWQVTDPEAVVRANLERGEPVLNGLLKDELWKLGRGFDPEDAGQAEDAAARTLRPPLPLGCGLTLNGLTVRLTIDSTRSGRWKDLDDEADRQAKVRSRVEELRRLLGIDDPYLLLQLAEHPSDTQAVLALVAQTRQQDVQNRVVVLDKLLQHGIISDADGDWLRPMVLGGAAPAVPGAPAAPAIGPGAVPAITPGTPAAPSWNVPQLGGGTPTALPARGGSTPAPGGSTPPAGASAPQAWSAPSVPSVPQTPVTPPVVSMPPPRSGGPRDRPRGTPAVTATPTTPASGPSGPRDRVPGRPAVPAAPEPAADESADAPSAGSEQVAWRTWRRPTSS